MDIDKQRRAFLVTAAGLLISAPVAYQIWRNRDNKRVHRFSDELQRVQSNLQVSVHPISGPTSFSLPLNPPVGRTLNYVIFSPARLPEGLSQALGDEPDVFLLREGKFRVERTNAGQVVMVGGDVKSMLCYPASVEERPNGQISLHVQNNQIRAAKQKGKELPGHFDQQFLNLLTLSGVPQGELTVGKKWKGTNGRVKPFTGYATQYEIAGLADIGGRKATHVRFDGKIPNIAQMPGVNAQKPEKDATMTCKHRGDAWFDLETGLLVRQEVEMTSFAGGIKGFKAKDGSRELAVTSKTIIQLFNA